MKHIISWVLRHIPRKIIQLFAHRLLKFYSLFLKGSKVFCPVCDHSFSKFLPYGRLQPRENALCPSCLSLERHRLMHLFLKNETNFYTSKPRVLHVAPEYCFIERFENYLGDNYITADIESPLAKVKMDLHDIPFPDNSFDVVFCNHVLEHVNDDVRCMQEIRRVLKPEGFALCQSPQRYDLETTYEDASITDPKEREIHFLQDDHLRIYGRDFGKQLENSGFTVIPVNMIEKLGTSESIRMALPLEEIIYQCKK
jgi:SAM-dependent methyltransferase